MKIINPSYTIHPHKPAEEILAHIEECARTCYKSEAKGDAAKFVRGLIARQHLAMLEHESLTVTFVCDRGVSHELVRHRMASYAQESTRYCNYSHDRFEGEITVIKPCYLTEGTEAYNVWDTSMELSERAYFRMLDAGMTPQEARAVLPMSLKTEIVMTANLREWRHFFELRAVGTTGTPHPQMRELAVPLLKDFAAMLPAVFGDLAEKLRKE